MFVSSNLIPRFCLPITCSVKGIIVFFFFSVYCHLQQNGRGMYTEPSTGYRYEGTLGHGAKLQNTPQLICIRLNSSYFCFPRSKALRGYAN